MSTPVYPSEALILGLCVGELRVTQSPFLAILRRRLLPIVPNLRSSASAGELPSPSYELLRLIFCLIVDELKESLEGGCADDVFESRNWLALIERVLAERVDLSTWRQGIGRMRPESLGNWGFIERLGVDDAEKIEKHLRRVTKKHGHCEFFELGRAFGLALSAYQVARSRLVQQLIEPDDDHDEFGMEQLSSKQRLDELREALWSYPYASSIIAYLGDRLDSRLGSGSGRLDEALDFVADVSSAFWQAFGVVLGEVRRDDETFARR